MEQNILIVVDMQHDFIDGSLGTPEAVQIIPSVLSRIRSYAADPAGILYATLDTHTEQYLDTAEGRHLPVLHCIRGTKGHTLDPAIQTALDACGCTYVEKPTFGSLDLVQQLQQSAKTHPIASIELCGLCTDICVVSNALLLKAAFPEVPISVHASCCAGVTPATHEAALTTMEMCQIHILREEN